MDANEKAGGSSRLVGVLRAMVRPATAAGDLRTLTDVLMSVSALLVVLALLLQPTGTGIAPNLLWILAAIAFMVLWVRLLWETLKTLLGSSSDRRNG